MRLAERRGTLQPASPAVSEAGNITPVKDGRTPSNTPKPNSEKKLLYAVSGAGVQDAPNYYTSNCLGNLTHGKQYEVPETIKGTTMTWYRISFNGKNGHVETKYLAAQQCSPTPKYAPTFSYDKPTVNLCPEMLGMINGESSKYRFVKLRLRGIWETFSDVSFRCPKRDFPAEKALRFAP